MSSVLVDTPAIQQPLVSQRSSVGDVPPRYFLRSHNRKKDDITHSMKNMHI